MTWALTAFHFHSFHSTPGRHTHTSHTHTHMQAHKSVLQYACVSLSLFLPTLLRLAMAACGCVCAPCQGINGSIHRRQRAMQRFEFCPCPCPRCRRHLTFPNSLDAFLQPAANAPPEPLSQTKFMSIDLGGKTAVDYMKMLHAPCEKRIMVKCFPDTCNQHVGTYTHTYICSTLSSTIWEKNSCEMR